MQGSPSAQLGEAEHIFTFTEVEERTTFICTGSCHTGSLLMLKWRLSWKNQLQFLLEHSFDSESQCEF